jgi:hypothetical protein
LLAQFCIYRQQELTTAKNMIMKKLFILFAVVAAFAACKGKSNADLQSNKDLLLLTDSSRMNSSYLTDTGAVANTPTRGGDEGNVAPVPSRSTNTGTNKPTGSSNSGNSTVSNNNNTTTAPAAPQKKGWSKAAKGATIGGVGGAVTGAVIGKNAKGAVIGGVLGAAGGYIIGRSKDKKDGRVQ